jgi:hypothetical protein
MRLLASLFRPSTHGHLPGWAALQLPPMQVLVHGMLTQLWAPLVSVGGLYRRLRKVNTVSLCMWPSARHVRVAVNTLLGLSAAIW